MDPRSSKYSQASSEATDVEWTPAPPAPAIDSPQPLALRPPPVAARLVGVRRRQRPIPARVTAPAAACPVCGRPGASVKASLGPITLKVCGRCARLGHVAAFIITRMLT
jgi:hypothetical protein